MKIASRKHDLVLELLLISIALSISYLLHMVSGYKMIVLHLYYLPVVLAGFFLGCYRASVLAFFCFVCASVITTLGLGEFTDGGSPLVIGLAVTMWGAALGLTTVLVGTLSDERRRINDDLHNSYVGVVEVLSQYLQCANPKLKARSNRVAELSVAVAEGMRLSQREVDNIRVAALLFDMEDIEITSTVIRKAVDRLETESPASDQHTFHGGELARSLGGVLSGAFPLLLSQKSADHLTAENDNGEIPLGARIIRAVRAYDNLCHSRRGYEITPQEVIKELRLDVQAEYPRAALDSLEELVCPSCETRCTTESTPAEPIAVG